MSGRITSIMVAITLRGMAKTRSIKGLFDKKNSLRGKRSKEKCLDIPVDTEDTTVHNLAPLCQTYCHLIL